MALFSIDECCLGKCLLTFFAVYKIKTVFHRCENKQHEKINKSRLDLRQTFHGPRFNNSMLAQKKRALDLKLPGNCTNTILVQKA